MDGIKKIMIIAGTRPEVIKLAPVYYALKKRPDRFKVVFVVTAQHRSMLDQALDVFRITPDLDLNLMRENQTPTQVAASVMAELEHLFQRERPDVVLIQEDTTTVAAAAWTAFHERIPVGHVEAGLRTRNRWQPFPEEINRRLVGVLADYHFAPTERACMNLLEEGIPAEQIFKTGNTVIDALFMIAEGPKGNHPVWDNIPEDRDIVLMTVHRREHFGVAIRGIFQAVRELADRHGDRITFVYPVHLNPEVHKPAFEILAGHPAILLTDPVDYQTLIHLMKRSILILTDSGGIQEEAPALKVPVVVLRDVTERPEAVEIGAAKLVGSEPQRILLTVNELLSSPEKRERMKPGFSPYGDGRAAERICAILSDEPWEPFHDKV